jgi:hypothetical protein
VDSAPRAYRLRASNTASSSSTSTGTSPADGVQDASLLSEQRSARDLLDVHLRTVDRHYDDVLRARLTHRAEDDVED